MVDYSMKIDTSKKALSLTAWKDSTFKSTLHYSISNRVEYVFEGIFKKDSICFVTRKIDLTKFPLIKDRGKLTWFW
jgi:hypothetical protein